MNMLNTFGIAWSFLGILLFLRQKEDGKLKRPAYFTQVLIVFSFPLVQTLLLNNLALRHPLNFLSSLVIMVPLLFGPVLYLYIRNILFNKKIVGPDLLHALPFLLINLINIVTRQAVQRVLNSLPSDALILKPLLGILNALSLMVYAAIILWILYRHKLSYQQYYSSDENRFSLTRLFYLLGSYLLIFLILILFLAILPFLPFRLGQPELFMNFSMVTFVLLFILIAFDQKILLEPSLGMDGIGLEETKTLTNEAAMNLGAVKEVYEFLETLMQEKKPYLDAGLSLQQLTDLTPYSRHQVSQAINLYGKENFYSYINRWRIDEFNSLIGRGRVKDFTLLSIAYDCGFSTQSAFYNAVRKIRNCTPKELVRSIEKTPS
jgi:AraC-like DNA-binding protein